jgi:hypothetical protein
VAALLLGPPLLTCGQLGEQPASITAGHTRTADVVDQDLDAPGPSARPRIRRPAPPSCRSSASVTAARPAVQPGHASVAAIAGSIQSTWWLPVDAARQLWQDLGAKLVPTVGEASAVRFCF